MLVTSEEPGHLVLRLAPTTCLWELRSSTQGEIDEFLTESKPMPGDRTLSCLSANPVQRDRQVANQPNDGVVCHTYDSYGSTQYDRWATHFLEFNVCDDLAGAGATGRVVEVTNDP